MVWYQVRGSAVSRHLPVLDHLYKCYRACTATSTVGTLLWVAKLRCTTLQSLRIGQQVAWHRSSLHMDIATK